MQDEKKCNPSPASPSDAPSETPSNDTANDTANATPRNAFHPEFLRRRQEREDEPAAALEAEARGPWMVFERALPVDDHDAERYEVYRVWEDPRKDRPAATFRDRELAYLYAAAQEIGGRGPVIRCSDRHTDRGHEVVHWVAEGEPEVVGHIVIYDQDVLPVFQVLETMLRAIEPLAQVLDAAGSSIVELLGRRLMAEE